MNAKAWWKSKTVWVGGLQLVAAITMYLIGFFQENNSVASPVEITLLINGIVMVVLRWLTNERIAINPEKIEK